MSLPINSTGIRDGEKIMGIGKQTLGTVMIVKGDYPPSSKWSNALTDVQVRDAIQIPFFKNMDTIERRQWLFKHSVNNDDLYLEDMPNLYVKFIKIGGTYFTQHADVTNQLLQAKDFLPIKDVFNMFPAKSGSRAGPRKKHTLVFRPSNWSVMPEEATVSFNGLLFDLSTYNAGYTNTNTTVKPTFVFEDIGLIAPTSGMPLTHERVMSLIGDNHSNITTLMEGMKWYPPSLHKSLIQKLIRTRATTVQMLDGTQYNAADVLKASLASLLLHPGAFVPNIQRYVTGIESAFKRVVVSVYEDSYSEHAQVLAMLLAVSLIVQQHKDYQVSDDQIRWLFYIAESALRDGRYYTRQITPTSMMDAYHYLSYLLLTEVKSFESDIRMLNEIAQSGGAYHDAGDQQSYIFLIYQSIDHHVFTDIAYGFDHNDMEYPELFSWIWEQSSKFNPRKQGYVFKIPDDIKEAQRRTWLWKSGDIDINKSQPQIVGYGTLQYTFDPDYLIGLVGDQKTTVNGKEMITVLRSSHYFKTVTVKRPSRADKDIKPLTGNEQHLAEEYLRGILQQGLMIEIPFLRTQALLSLSANDEYMITLRDQGTMHLWLDLVNNVSELPIIEEITATQGNIGLLIDGNERLRELISATDLKVLMRLAMYLEGNHEIIQLYKIGRDGKGVDYSVSRLDTKVFNLLKQICYIYPGALSLVTNGFKVGHLGLFFSVRDYIIHQTRRRSHTDPLCANKCRWMLLRDENRQLRDYQQDALAELINSERRGHIIWIEVGMGKTLIVTSYIRHLIAHQALPPYVVYTLPTSAINSIMKEMDLAGLPITLIDMRVKPSSGTTNTLIPYTINLIAHDHMKMNGMDEQLRKVASDMFFICDEFHLCLSSKTIRTSLALEISKLSRQFIAMSGTILNSQDGVDDLISWLEQVVPYPVTHHNYFAAVGSLIAKKISTGIPVIREDVDVSMTGEVLQRYKQLVPANLGGTATSIHLQEAISVCYETITKAMVIGIIEQLRKGHKVFVVARNIAHQEQLRDQLLIAGVASSSMHLITRDTPITLLPDDISPINVVITTIKHSAGYTVTKMNVMVTSVYFSNEATREQLEGRINRIGQTAPSLLIVTYHTGVLSYIYDKYKMTRNITAALKGFAKEVGTGGNWKIDDTDTL